MSDAPINPYQSSTYDPAVTAGGGGTKRPTGLLIFCVLILAFSSMGLLGNLFGGVMLAINGGKVDYKQQFGANGGGGVDINPEALDKMQALGPSHSARSIAQLIAGTIVSAMLIVGCIGAIYPMRWGGAMLTLACGAAILFLIAHGVMTMMTTQDILAIVKEYPDDFLTPKDGGGADPRAIEMANMVMRITYQAISIITWIFNAIKIIFYAAVMGYLRKTNVQQFIKGTG